ncbi:MAG TPA: hypothetical protein VKF37_07850 [Chloroflexota bacterium]|nr:hypothetical protein [Chloroflexota bacterium]
MMLYPDLARSRLGYVVADLAAVLWVATWLYAGDLVYHGVMTLSTIANGVITVGQQVNDAVSHVQQAVGRLPLVGPALGDDLNPLHGVPHAVITTGRQELQAIHHLALLLGVVVAGVPLLAVALIYLPLRQRKARGFRSLARIVRQPGANAVSATMQVLAARALYTLPYDRLLRYSRDPIGEWREGRYYNLARAAMAEEGLDVQRYLHRVQRLTVPSEHYDLPTIGDG